MENLGRLALILNVRFEWLATGRGPMSLSTQRNSRRKARSLSSNPTDVLLQQYRSLSAPQRGTMLDFIRMVADGHDGKQLAHTEQPRSQTQFQASSKAQ